MATSQYEPEENIADEEVYKFFTGSFASSKLTVINLTREKLTVNNISQENRSPPKKDRPPPHGKRPWIRKLADSENRTDESHSAYPRKQTAYREAPTQGSE